MRIIDLRSDTVTKPTKGMLKAMMEAEVGDDVFKTDPTVNKLQAKIAKMFGKKVITFPPEQVDTYLKNSSLDFAFCFFAEVILAILRKLIISP